MSMAASGARSYVPYAPAVLSAASIFDSAKTSHTGSFTRRSNVDSQTSDATEFLRDGRDYVHGRTTFLADDNGALTTSVPSKYQEISVDAVKSANSLLDRMVSAAVSASSEACQAAASQVATRDEEIHRLKAELAEADADRRRLRSRVQSLSQCEAELHIVRGEAQRALTALAQNRESNRQADGQALMAAEAEIARLQSALAASDSERAQLASLLQMSRFDYDRLASISASSESMASTAGTRLQQMQGKIAEAEAQRAREVGELKDVLDQTMHERDLYKGENEGLRGLAQEARLEADAFRKQLASSVATLTGMQQEKKRLEDESIELRTRHSRCLEQMHLLKEDGLRQDRELQEQGRRYAALTNSTAQAVANAYAAAQEMQKGKEAAELQIREIQVELQACRRRIGEIESERESALESLQGTLGQVQQERDNYKANIERLKVQLQQAQDAASAALRESAEARSSLAASQQDMKDLRGQLHHAQAQIQMLTENATKQAREWQERVQQHEALQTTAETRLASSYAQVQALEQERDAAVLRFAEVFKEKEGLAAQLVAAQNATVTSTQDAKAIHEQLQAREAMIGSLTEQIQELQRKVIQLSHHVMGQGQGQVAGPPVLPPDPSVQDFLLHLQKLGLKSAQLVIGVDCTKSNLWSGKISHKGRSLHDVSDPSVPTPYERIMAIFGRALKDFDDDGMIPLYGFGCSRTQEHSVFSFKPGQDDACHGVEEAIEVYRGVIPTVKLDGPTSFAPLIKKTIETVKKRPQFTVLVIIADGQVTAVKETEAAIVEASKYPIAIITVGVGDGPWEEMRRFDDALPQRKVDNFQFIEYLQVLREATASGKDIDAHFILSALGELPDMITSMKQAKMLPSK